MQALEDVIFELLILKTDAERNCLTDTVDRYNHIVALLRELQERRKEPKIIFCKDCVDWGTEDCAMVQIVDYDPDCDWTNPDGYCHMAERRTDD